MFRFTLPSLSWGLATAAILASQVVAGEVEIRQNGGNWKLQHNGKPYFIRGAGGKDHLEELVKHGGNSIRTWGIETLEEKVDGKPLMDRCLELGITVTAGLWLEHERHGFDYSDPKQIQKQRDEVRQAVRKYKDHPALLIWGLGNEMEGPDSKGKDSRIWKELNVLAEIVKQEDSKHPVLTVIAGASSDKVKGILEHYPNIDILGVNSYAAASAAVGDIKAAGWKKPFVLTEFGPSGHWEVPATSWGAAIEPTSRSKSASYFVTQSILTDEASDICLGSYCFLWGNKQEKTATWYGMFLPTGEKLPQVDAMCRAWTGKWPENRCPRISKFETALSGASVGPSKQVMAKIEASDPNDDVLQWSWHVVAESKEQSVGGDRESVPPSIPNCIVRHRDGQAVIRTPTKPGAYRLFVIIRDGNGAAASENICFKVSGS